MEYEYVYKEDYVDHLDLQTRLRKRGKQGWSLVNIMSVGACLELVFMKKVKAKKMTRKELEQWFEDNTVIRPFNEKDEKDGNRNYIHRTKVGDLLYNLGATKGM